MDRYYKVKVYVLYSSRRVEVLRNLKFYQNLITNF